MSRGYICKVQCQIFLLRKYEVLLLLQKERQNQSSSNQASQGFYSDLTRKQDSSVPQQPKNMTVCMFSLPYTSLFFRQVCVKLPRLAPNSFYSQSWPQTQEPEYWDHRHILSIIQLKLFCMKLDLVSVVAYITGYSLLRLCWSACNPLEGVRYLLLLLQITRYKTVPQKMQNSLFRNHR